MIKFLPVFALFIPSILFGQAPNVPIFDQSNEGYTFEERSLGKQVSALEKNSKLLSVDAIKKLLKSPTPQKIDSPSPSTKKLSPVEIARLAQQKNYRVGWCYICTNCDHWHFMLGGGYPISKDGVIATCAHVIEANLIPKKFVKATLIVVDSDDKVWPITGITAYNATLDAAFVKIDSKTTPYALNDQIHPGQPTYCFSRPMDQGKYFSTGIVNRFYWDKSVRGKDQKSLEALEHLKINVSCRWAPGSSGSPVLDHCGNAIGHVALIENLGDDNKNKKKGKGKQSGGDSYITLHSAIPARSLQALMRQQK